VATPGQQRSGGDHFDFSGMTINAQDAAGVRDSIGQIKRALAMAVGSARRNM